MSPDLWIGADGVGGPHRWEAFHIHKEMRFYDFRNAWKDIGDMPNHTLISWNKLISAYAKHGQAKEALAVFEQMQREGVEPDKVTFLSALKACASLASLELGRRIHLRVKENAALVSDVFVGSRLVDMYVKCGSLEEARKVFDGMRLKDLVLWNGMVAGYAKNGYSKEVLTLFSRMQSEEGGGLKPDEFTYVSVLKACTAMGDLDYGKQIHARIRDNGIGLNVFVGTALIDMYAKCGSMENARPVFDGMLQKDAVLWNAMIAGYADHNHGEEALALFDRMECEGVKPDRVTLVSALKACTNLESLRHGKRVHASVNKNGFESDAFVSSTLVDMCSKCGRIEDASKVFERIKERDVVAWNAMITGYSQCGGHSLEALALFERMQLDGVKPDSVTFVGALNACAGLGDLEQGQQIHASIRKSGNGFESDIFVANALIDMYSKCRSMGEARKVFEGMQQRDVISWTSLIAGYSLSSHGQEALALFVQMQRESVKPNEFTFVVILKACAGLADLEEGRKIHALIKREGFESNLLVRNTLIDMYVKCGCMEDARQVFDGVHQRDVILWSTLIAGYCLHGFAVEVLTLFEQMQRENVLEPDRVILVSALKACAILADLERGKKVHASIKERGLESNVSVMSSLVEMYLKCGSEEDAREVVCRMERQDKVLWSDMMAGYAENGHDKEAIALFGLMQREGVKLDMSSIICVLKACANLADLEQGRRIHASIQIINVLVGNALINMYIKCRSIEDARQVFDGMPLRDVVTWNLMIEGYEQLGHSKEALELFRQMQKEEERVKPNESTFTFVLSACSHEGLIDEACQLFHNHTDSLRREHYAFMVGFLSQSGRLVEAEEFIDKMPIQPDVAMWMTLLSACRVHGILELGRHVFERVLKLEPKHAAAYELLSNMYTAVGRWDEAAKLRKEMEEQGVQLC